MRVAALETSPPSPPPNSPPKPKNHGNKGSSCLRRILVAVVASLALFSGLAYVILYFFVWDWGPAAYALNESTDAVKVFVTPDELSHMIDTRITAGASRNTSTYSTVTILDARTNTDSLIPGAVHAPWKMFTKGGGMIPEASYFTGGSDNLVPTGLLLPIAELEAKVRALGVRAGPNHTVIVYGAWHRVTYKFSMTGQRTWGEEGRLFWMFHYLNISRVMCLYGGINAWRKRNLPLQSLPRQPIRPAASPLTVHPAAARRATARGIGALLRANDTRLVLLDARTHQEFSAPHSDTTHGASRGGHIRGATSYFWERVFTDGNLRTQQQLRSELKQYGVSFTSTQNGTGMVTGMVQPSTVVTYCTGGIRSGFLYMVLVWLGVPHLQNYDGSWWEWALLHPT